MNKKYLFVLILTLLLASCATTVSMNSLVPSEINLGADQVIAVAPVSASYSGNKNMYIPIYIEKEIPVPEALVKLSPSETLGSVAKSAEYASDLIYRSLSQGVYKIVEPATTQKYLKSVSLFNSAAKVLSNKGVTLLFEGSLDALNYDECIKAKAFKNSEGKIYYNYYLVQKASVSFSYRLQDLKTGKTVDAQSFFGKYPTFDYENQIFIGQIDVNGKFSMVKDWQKDVSYIYNTIIDGFMSGLRDRLIPHVVKLNFTLKSEKGNEEFEELNKLVQQGYMNIALDNYLSIYKKTGNLVAAYNYSVLYYAIGNQKEAIDFALGVYNKTLNADMGKLITKMTEAYAKEQMALNQITK